MDQPAPDAAAQGTNRRRVAVLTPGGGFTDALLALLAERGLAVDALVLYLPLAAGEWRKAATRGARLMRLARTPLRWLRASARQRAQASAMRGAMRVIRTGMLNGARMERDLRRLALDALVLARCGLVDARILAIPRDGVVNVHPGLLPWIRGNSPLANSLARGIPLGVTAFRVDPGIDTGAVLARRLVPFRGGEPIAEVRDAIFRLWVEMTADVVGDALAGTIPAGTPQRERFPLCRTVSDPAAIAAMEDAVRRGEPRALLDRWMPLCDPSDLSLRTDPHAELIDPRAQ